MLADTVAQMRDDGVEPRARLRDQRVRRLLVVPAVPGGHRRGPGRTSAPGAPVIDKLRHFHDHPGFVEPHADAVRAALATLDPARRATTRLVFTAHSHPGLDGRHRRPGRRPVRGPAAARPPRLVARRGRPRPALGPGLAEPLRPAAGAVAGAGRQRPPGRAGRRGRHRRGGQPDRVRLRPPRGDLGPRQRGRGDGRGARPGLRPRGTPGTDPRFVAMVRELVAGADRAATRRASRLGTLPVWDVCPADCCPPPARRRGALHDRAQGRSRAG